MSEEAIVEDSVFYYKKLRDHAFKMGLDNKHDLNAKNVIIVSEDFECSIIGKDMSYSVLYALTKGKKETAWRIDVAYDMGGFVDMKLTKLRGTMYAPVR